jgi:large subunit ribosomal protein L25
MQFTQCNSQLLTFFLCGDHAASCPPAIMGLTAQPKSPHPKPSSLRSPQGSEAATLAFASASASLLPKTLHRPTMLLRRPLHALTLHLLRRHLAAAAKAVISPADLHHTDPLSLPYDYLPGHPRPNPKHDEVISAVPRASSGRHLAAKERKAGRVPAIVFEQENGQEGGNKRLVSVQSKQIRKLVDHLGRSFFLSRLFRLQVWSEHAGQGDLVESVRVLPRKVAALFD